MLTKDIHKAADSVSAPDFGIFAECMAGPEVTDPPLGCDPPDFVAADLESDGDVDLADFVEFQMAFTGSLSCAGQVVHLPSTT